jgi:site-specific recombinase XerD
VGTQTFHARLLQLRALRLGYNLRHSLASYLVTQTKTDVKTVQSMLRPADIGTTLDIYTHAINKHKLAAQNQVMDVSLKP